MIIPVPFDVLNMPFGDKGIMYDPQMFMHGITMGEHSLDIMAMRITDWLESRGFRAFPVPQARSSRRSVRYFQPSPLRIWPGRLESKSCCLIT